MPGEATPTWHRPIEPVRDRTAADGATSRPAPPAFSVMLSISLVAGASPTPMEVDRARAGLLEPPLEMLASRDSGQQRVTKEEAGDCCVDDERAEGGVVDDRRRARQLSEADDGRQRRSLEELDQEAHGRWQRDPERLGQ